MTTTYAPILTYADAIDQLIGYIAGSSEDAQQRLLRQVVQNAYRDLVNHRSWKCFYEHTRVQMNAAYQIGTISYSQATQTITADSGSGISWPSWAANGRIRINGSPTSVFVCEVDQLTSSTTLTVTNRLNPGADLPTGTSYILFQDVYPLPSDIRKISDPTTYNTWASQYISPQDWQWLEWHANVTGYPVRWTIMRDPKNVAGWALCVQPLPSTNLPFDFVANRWGAQIKWSGKEPVAYTGTIACSASTAVTGTTTAFDSTMAGSILRVLAGTNLPEGQGGLYPYTEEAQIRSVTDGTHLVLSNALTGTYSGAAFVISDPIDLPQTMVDAFLWACRYQYAMTGRMKNSDFVKEEWRESLLRAMEADTMVEIERAVGDNAKYFDRGWNGPLAPNIS